MIHIYIHIDNSKYLQQVHMYIHIYKMKSDINGIFKLN